MAGWQRRLGQELEEVEGPAAARPVAPAPGPQGQVLALQRAAGNHATATLIQRKLATDSAALGEAGTASKVKLAFGGSSVYEKIRKALDEYHAATTVGKQYLTMRVLLALIVKWMDANASSKTHGNQKRMARLQSLAFEIATEMASLGKGGEYLADLEEQMGLNEADKTAGGGRANRDKGKFRNASSQVSDALKDSHELAEGRGKKAATDLIKQYGLTEADVAAIRIYTVDDYKYINPAMAENEGWMKSQLPKTAGNADADVSADGLKQAQAEGQRHGGMTVEALRKLPAWKGDTFRGLGLTTADLAKEYPKGKDIVQKPFLSTTLEQAVADSFAKQNAGQDGKSGVLIHFKLTEGRDIAALSKYGSEKEILVIAGAGFHVDDVKKRDSEDVYDVWLTQTG